MREAGEPLPVRVIVRRMLATKGVKVADRRTLKVIKTRLHNVLLRTDARGLTVKVGSGRETRRGLCQSKSRFGLSQSGVMMVSVGLPWVVQGRPTETKHHV